MIPKLLTFYRNATVDDLERYHGTQHALADLAYFIDTFKLENNLTVTGNILKSHFCAIGYT